jgi:hypothetical protein
VLRLGPRARVIFAGLWVAGQGTLIVTAAWRPDHVFGFRMFPEASTIEIRLQRELETGLVAAPGGEWAARGPDNQLRHFSWHDRVRDPVLGSLDTRVFASYGVDGQMARLQRALDDVADHMPEDAETIRLRASVAASKNGGEPMALTLESHRRKVK